MADTKKYAIIHGFFNRHKMGHSTFFPGQTVWFKARVAAKEIVSLDVRITGVDEAGDESYHNEPEDKMAFFVRGIVTKRIPATAGIFTEGSKILGYITFNGIHRCWLSPVE